MILHYVIILMSITMLINSSRLQKNFLVKLELQKRNSLIQQQRFHEPDLGKNFTLALKNHVEQLSLLSLKNSIYKRKSRLKLNLKKKAPHIKNVNQVTIAIKKNEPNMIEKDTKKILITKRLNFGKVGASLDNISKSSSIGVQNRSLVPMKVKMDVKKILISKVEKKAKKLNLNKVGIRSSNISKSSLIGFQNRSLGFNKKLIKIIGKETKKFNFNKVEVKVRSDDVLKSFLVERQNHNFTSLKKKISKILMEKKKVERSGDGLKSSAKVQNRINFLSKELQRKHNIHQIKSQDLTNKQQDLTNKQQDLTLKQKAKDSTFLNLKTKANANEVVYVDRVERSYPNMFHWLVNDNHWPIVKFILLFFHAVGFISCLCCIFVLIMLFYIRHNIPDHTQQIIPILSNVILGRDINRMLGLGQQNRSPSHNGPPIG